MEEHQPGIQRVKSIWELQVKGIHLYVNTCECVGVRMLYLFLSIYHWLSPSRTIREVAQQ